MNILKISNHYINIESVIHLIDEEGEITLFFNTHDRDRPYHYRFEGEEATQLRKWLTDNSTEL
ncbi:hypothetical protein [Rhodohalobacter halophilus]|uniref:hypothetical protein n=1 Tax=Rhodohalobacter halophilus TaxID=1812810 RepID=UPI00083F9D4F|nr:hypothetical protein [Rhodohalobacter halophilus]